MSDLHMKLLSLQEALGGALQYVKQADLRQYELSALIQEAADHKPDVPKPISALLQSIAAEPVLSVFQGMLVLPAMAVRFNQASLAMWLVVGAERKGVSNILEDLSRYVSAPEIPFLWVSAIQGISLSAECKVSEDCSWVPWKDLPESEHTNYVYRSAIQRGRHPSSVLLHRFSSPKTHVGDSDYSGHPLLNVRFDDTDTILCATLFGPSAPVLIATWTEIPDWMPSWGTGLSAPPPTDMSEDVEWPASAYEEFPKLLARFRALDPSVKAMLRVPLERLNRAIRRPQHVDAAIDAGIALESLFTNDIEDDRGDFTYKLKLRSSRYLFSDFKQRKDTFRLVGKLYHLRSKAVHTGVLSEKTPDEVSQLLQEGYRIVSTAIKKMIEGGVPKWRDFDLSTSV